MMNMWAVAGFRSAAMLSMPLAAAWIFSRAEASQSGWPQISAPILSASYSRDRLIAICTRAAAVGARTMIRIVPTIPSGLLRLLPISQPQVASMEIAPAMVAVMVMVRVSRFFTWASSWAMTPATSSGLRRRSSPVVAATAAFSGFRPVAKALGWSFSIR